MLNVECSTPNVVTVGNLGREFHTDQPTATATATAAAIAAVAVAAAVATANENFSIETK